MECAMISGPSIQSPAVNQALEEKINIAIHPEYPEQTVAIGSTLTRKKKRTGTGRNQGNPRRGGKNLRGRRNNEGDFKDLNNACPKDCYPLPEIDWKVESLCGYSFKCFLDATETPEAEEAFRQMKKLIAELPTLTAPRENEEFKPYIAAAKKLLACGLDDGQRRQANTSIFCKPHSTRPESQLYPYGKVGISLAQYFIVERPEEESPDELMAEPEVLPEPWTLFTDGSFLHRRRLRGRFDTNKSGRGRIYICHEV
ncbi:hypothetical protein Tco_0822133 [Tanacetum coccineum]|uniref:Uncharacterized protein n=1 Tax=Tanacetum coccineum TaxID=301880 RepID=A0ABQ5AFZ3_9ASTR